MRTARLTLPALVALAAPLFGQRSLVAPLERALEHTEPASARWYELQLELGAAELRFDVAAAERRARAALATLDAEAAPALRSALSALAELARATGSGPARVDAALRDAAGASVQASDAPAQLRYHAHWFAAQRRALTGDAGEELSHGLSALEAARETASVLRRARAIYILLPLLGEASESLERELRHELDELVAEEGARSLRPRRDLLVYDEDRAAWSLDECAERLEEIAELAEEVGDDSLLGVIEIYRADLAAVAELAEEAYARFEAAAQRFEEVGSPSDQAYAHELATDYATFQGDHALARRELDAAVRLVEGRGFSVRDAGLLRSRLGLAMAGGDEAEMLELRGPYDELVRHEDEARRAFVVLRERLLAPERSRLEHEHRRATERAAYEAELRRAERLGLFGVAGALGLLVLCVAWSRWRLVRLNRALAREIARASEEERDRRSLEDRMRALERTESLGRITAGVAHDFNNLALLVLGYTDLLLPDERNPDRRKNLEAIAAAGERAAELCGRLQSHARSGSVDREALDPEQLLRELQPALQAAAGLRTSVVLRSVGELPLLEADREELEQAILNLVVNGRDAGAREVEVVVRSRTLTQARIDGERLRGEAAPGEFVAFEVRDDGEGMTPDQIERIFDPFYSTRFPGRGLGLAAVLGAVQRHGGLFGVSSEPGTGSRLSLLLPLEPAAALPRGAGAAGDVALASVMAGEDVLDVLVIEDEGPVRKLITSMLAARGHRARGIHDASAARGEFGTFETPSRAIVLLDLTMPAVEGRDLIAPLRARYPGVPIVLMSGQSEEELERAAEEHALEGTLVKPFSLEELEAALTRARAAQARA